MLTSRYGRPAGTSLKEALLLPSHWISMPCGILNSLQEALLGKAQVGSLGKAQVGSKGKGQVGSLGKALGSMVKATGSLGKAGATPQAPTLQAALQVPQLEGNLSSLGGGSLRKAGTSPMLVPKSQGQTLMLPVLGQGALVHPAGGWKKGGWRGGAKMFQPT